MNSGPLDFSHWRSEHCPCSQCISRALYCPNYVLAKICQTKLRAQNASDQTRTGDLAVNSRTLYLLSYRGTYLKGFCIIYIVFADIVCSKLEYFSLQWFKARLSKPFKKKTIIFLKFSSKIPRSSRCN